MTENTKLWDLLGRTDPAATKGFTRGGGFKGTAIKPMWSYRRMTEEFGPCGQGWGVGMPEFQVVPATDGEILVYCTVYVWYRHEDKPSEQVYGVGGDKVVAKFSSGLKSDDEAFKKAFTDAVTNALKLIGVGADVHMGMFDDSKYVNTMREEFAEGNSPAKRQVGINPKTGMATASALKKDNGPDNWDAFQSELLECETVPSLTKLALGWSSIAERDKWPATWRDLAKEEINKRRELVLNGIVDDDTFPGDRPSGRSAYVDNFIP
ncbi:hypothetical protein LB545_07575 [Mesorhizobium sp. BR1-1-6]|uniref:hypothetical protein n=1 Tax=Mesorhizobium sp. BR1-1-6 TaxID=2876648 RepID=UPI001CD0DA8D|nr:hypothetical protein [Mesorhizobium sp. BR1-1-6]MBZ9894202.1 hypothetical protein [Mesorhizobium sp. BR1-1-6]